MCPQLESRPDGWELELAGCTKVVQVEIKHPLWTFSDADFDQAAEQAGAVPYSDWLYRGIGVVALRLASYLTRRPFKVVCVVRDFALCCRTQAPLIILHLVFWLFGGGRPTGTCDFRRGDAPLLSRGLSPVGGKAS